MPSKLKKVAPSTMPPPGMPGAAMFSVSANTSISRNVPTVTGRPVICMVNIARRQKETAPPHIWIVQPSGAATPAMCSGTSNSSRQVRSVSGSVAAEEQVESAVRSARPVLRK